MSYSIPILITTFLRLDELIELFEVLEIVKPLKLFITSDGPRNELDKKRVNEVRNFLNSISWECEVHRLYNDDNLGIHKNVEKALEYVFSKVDKIVFLEDDVLPTPSFFKFAEIMLDFYQSDHNIKMINGHNMATHIAGYDAGYFLTRRTSSSCNAYWKRTYLELNEIKANFEFYLSEFNFDSISDIRERRHLKYLFQKQLNSNIMSNEIILIFLLHYNNGFNLVANHNLSKLRGNDEFGSNTHESDMLLPRKIREIYTSPVNDLLNINFKELAEHNLTYDIYLSELFAEGRIIIKFLYNMEIILNYIFYGKFKILFFKIKSKLVRLFKRKIGKNGS